MNIEGLTLNNCQTAQFTDSHLIDNKHKSELYLVCREVTKRRTIYWVKST